MEGRGSAAFSFVAFQLRKHCIPMAQIEQMCYNQLKDSGRRYNRDG